MAKIITEKTQIIDIPEGKKKERIDLFLTKVVEHATRTRIQKLIEAGNVTVNGKPTKANYKITPSDQIIITIPITPRPEYAEPENIPVNIVFEDDYLIIVNKPAGQVVHPAYSNYTGTLVNALLYHTQSDLSETDDESRPGIVHRIDKDTSGLLVVAKDTWTHAKLAEQFMDHSIEREYAAVIWGRLKERSGRIEKNITRSKQDRKKFTVSDSEGKFAATNYQVIEEYEFASLLKVTLETGRTHQIRVHLSSIGHPVFGDETYGGTAIRAGTQLPKIKTRVASLLTIMPRQALHAKTLGFIHPHTNKKISFDSDLPDDMQTLILNLKPA